jgi:Flp pilus assembly protein TadD
LLAEGQLQEAELELSRVLAQNIPGERDRGYTRRGCLRVERGDARGAQNDLNKVFKLGDTGRLCLGRAHALLANHAEALEILVPLLEAGTFDPHVGRLAIRASLSLRRIPEALRLAGLAAKKHPSDVPTLALLAQTQAVTGATKEALLTLQSAQRMDRKSPEVPFIRGNIHWAMEKYDEAAADYRAALEHNPAFAEAARNLGVALIQGGRYKEAVTALRKALDLLPDDLGVMNNLGVALATTGRAAQAATLYEEARKSQPDEPRLLNNLVDVYIRLGRLDEARELLRLLVDEAPLRANANQRLRDLESFEVLLGFLCQGEGAVKETRDRLKERQWSHSEIVDSLERVLSDTIFSAALERKEQECKK